MEDWHCFFIYFQIHKNAKNIFYAVWSDGKWDNRNKYIRMWLEWWNFLCMQPFFLTQFESWNSILIWWCFPFSGSLILEMGALSRLTGDSRYEASALRALHKIWSMRSPLNLMGTTLDVVSGDWIEHSSGIGAGKNATIQVNIILQYYSLPVCKFQMFNEFILTCIIIYLIICILSTCKSFPLKNSLLRYP